jgi:hypothetical protein
MTERLLLIASWDTRMSALVTLNVQTRGVPELPVPVPVARKFRDFWVPDPVERKILSSGSGSGSGQNLGSGTPLVKKKKSFNIFIKKNFFFKSFLQGLSSVTRNLIFFFLVQSD